MEIALTDEQKNVLMLQKQKLLQDMEDLRIDVEELDMKLNKTIDLGVKRVKAELRARRHGKMEEMNAHAYSLNELERTILSGKYNVNENTEGNDDGRRQDSDRETADSE